MSDARKCDQCGRFYEPEPGDVFIESMHVSLPGDVKGVEYTEVDLCATCAGPMITAMDKALEKVREYLSGEATPTH